MTFLDDPSVKVPQHRFSAYNTASGSGADRASVASGLAQHDSTVHRQGTRISSSTRHAESSLNGVPVAQVLQADVLVQAMELSEHLWQAKPKG